MEMRRTLLNAATLLLVALPAMAQDAPPPPPEHQMRMKQEMGQMHQMQMRHMDPMAQVAVYAPPHLLERKDALELSDEQVSRLEALAAEFKEGHHQAVADAEAHHKQAMEIWMTDSPDIDQLRAHAEAAMQAQQTAHMVLLVAAAQGKALLDAEQRGHVAGWLEAQQHMMHQRMQGMQGMHQGMGEMKCHMPHDMEKEEGEHHDDDDDDRR
jgi:hypothetical protein